MASSDGPRPTPKLAAHWPRERVASEGLALLGHKPSAERPYLFEEPGPLWAFGHGGSFTTFRYDPIKVNPARISPDSSTARRACRAASGPARSNRPKWNPIGFS